jgi:hypothetical protein
VTEVPRRSDGTARAEGPPAAIRDAIRAVVAADLAPVRARSLRARVLVVAAAAAATIALTAPSFGMNLTGTVPEYGRASIVASLVALLGILAIVGSFAPLGGLRLGPRAKLVTLGALLAGWAAYLVTIATALSSSGAAAGMAATACATRSAVPGVLAGIVSIWAFRHADPWTPRRTGALVGAAGGCIAAAGLGLSCGSLELGHLLLGHGLVVPLLALLGALTARRTLRP